MSPSPSSESSSAIATAILLIALMSFSSIVWAKDRGPQMKAPQISRHVERMLWLYDTNGDGKITLAEINADQARMFTALDVDGNKSMAVDEIRRRGRSLLIFRTTTLFDLLDANGDGKLSVVEVQAPSKRWFKRYDKNGDGVMEASEIPKRRWQRGGRGRAIPR